MSTESLSFIANYIGQFAKGVKGEIGADAYSEYVRGIRSFLTENVSKESTKQEALAMLMKIQNFAQIYLEDRSESKASIAEAISELGKFLQRELGRQSD